MHYTEVTQESSVGGSEGGEEGLPAEYELSVLWPIRKAVQPGELLSSWLGRVAQSFSTTVIELGRWGPIEAERTSLLDFDRAASERFRDFLARGSGFGRARIDETLLRSFDGIVFPKLVHGTWGQWIVPRSLADGARDCRTGQPYCSDCLRNDPVPYFRKAWRLAFYTICPMHGRLLTDQCGTCATPVNPVAEGAYSFSRAGKPHWLCTVCGAGIASTRARRPTGPLARGVDLQKRLLRQFEAGSIDLGPGLNFDNSVHFFEGARLLASLFVRPKTRFPILAALDSTGVAVAKDVMDVKTLWFEAAGCEFRHEVTRLILLLLEDWPHRFVEVMRLAGLTWTELVGDHPVLPHWLEAILAMELRKNRYLSEDEVLRARQYIRESGRDVSRNRVKRVLGVTESRKINSLIEIPREVFTQHETRRYFREFDAGIRFASDGRGNRLSVARDRTVVLMVALGLGSIEEVVGWTLDMFPDLVARSRTFPFDRRKAPAVFGEAGMADPALHLVWYFNFILGAWENREPGKPVLAFASRNLTPIHIESVRIRAGVVKDRAGLQALASCIEGLRLPDRVKAAARQSIVLEEAAANSVGQATRKSPRR